MNLLENEKCGVFIDHSVEKVAIAMHCNLKVAVPVALCCLLPTLYCACAESETATSELPIKTPTSPLDSATAIS